MFSFKVGKEKTKVLIDYLSLQKWNGNGTF